MDYKNVLDFWFGELKGEVTKEDRNRLWFGGDEAVDNEIKSRFQHTVSEAGEGKLKGWTDTAEGTLAHIILLDQFTRNLYRGLSAAYRYDALALAICKNGLAKSVDVELAPIQRVFFYLPLEHSENLDDQEESMFRFDQLRKAVSSEHREMFDGFFDYAKEHHDIVAQFGRFPHRNAVSGRLSTVEEMAWLNAGGKRFGQ